ncbi:hypothetical protein FRZ67_16120 [Panacibacter ginsenosidivorans]|uniref:Cytochrome C Planctomycete-type domain-containing protein n=1 Tax=Panacibacter ginsenosidivorans TaxID=1813871 RepID=A0A5B8VCJ7_9BACT|nr:hypothetical protein [Panacibacter ginsenosidivorans]QEC68755.1 hypothetical protein FRZ67_16120 [Panacibacter ginsenosidivorans]
MKTLITYYSSFSILKRIFVAAAIAGFMFACKKTAPVSTSVDCSGPVKSFSGDVNSIVQTSCATDSDCHGSGSHSGPGELLTYPEIFNARTAIRTAVATGVMPKGGTLTTAEKNALLCWIDNGAVNN